jgi:NADH:ubiquinone oxidoreductase subunit 3 (subunit A)
MREEEAIVAFLIGVAIVFVVTYLIYTIRKMYQIHRETALKMKCLECGLNVRDIERVVASHGQRRAAQNQLEYDSRFEDASYPRQKPIPPVVAAR